MTRLSKLTATTSLAVVLALPAVAANPDLLVSIGRGLRPPLLGQVFGTAWRPSGISDWTTATEADIATSSGWLREVHPNVRTSWSDGATLGQLMGTGEVLIAWD